MTTWTFWEWNSEINANVIEKEHVEIPWCYSHSAIQGYSVSSAVAQTARLGHLIWAD